METKKSLLR